MEDLHFLHDVEELVVLDVLVEELVKLEEEHEELDDARELEISVLEFLLETLLLVLELVGLGCDRGKRVPSFDEMMDIALVEVDFDDPTTNVRGRRALAIAKPTPRGY